MAAINQITIAGGSTYDVNDKRITTSAVSTATHFLATDSSISSIAPITAANLASVLGGLPKNEAMTNVNDSSISCNDLGSEEERYTVYKVNAAQDKPSGSNGGYLTSYSWGGGYLSQVYVDGDNATMYTRAKYRGTWGVWSKVSADIPDFYKSYNNLSALASALGGEAVTGAGDADTITDLIHAIQNYNVTNAPSAIQYGVLITLRWGTAMKIQYAYSAQKGASYSRLFANNSWGDWKKNYDENILSNSTDLASLASALGAAYWYNNETAADLDNKTTPQTIQYWNPSAGIVTVIVHRDSDSHLSQTKITRDSLYYRYKWNNAWNGWYEVTPPNFYKDYSNLSSLASALGGLPELGGLNGIKTMANADANNIPNGVIYLTSNPSNMPEPYTFVLSSISHDANGNPTDGIQIAVSVNSGKSYTRHMNTHVWGQWKQLAITT